MVARARWPSLEGWDITRDSLHAYAKLAGAAPRVLAEPHPKWWHVSLEVAADGLLSNLLEHPQDGEQSLRTLLNLRRHTLELHANGRVVERFDLTTGDSATALGRKLQAALTELGIKVQLPEEKYANDQPGNYDPGVVERYFAALRAVADAMSRLSSELGGERSPVQLWPHHFDLAFEWYGTKVMTYEEAGEQRELPAQLNFGFAPGDESYAEPYFYSNPWPFEPSLISEPLPHGARWFTEGFEGTLLAYRDLRALENPADKLLAYYRRVFALAKPNLVD